MNTKRKRLSFETAKLSREEIALFLIKTAKKANLVNRKVKAFSTHPHFSVIYNKEELQEILNITIAKVVNAHEAYILKCKGKEIPEDYPSISDELDLSTFGNLTGYMRSAYDNNVSKDYKKHIATKRSGELISYDSASQEDSDDSKQGNAVLNQLQEDSIEDITDEKEYKRLIKEILFFLKKYDKKMNELYAKRNKGEIREEKKSRLAYLFLYLINPKYKAKYVYIKDKLPWTQYLYKKYKEELSSVILNNFSDEAEFLYNYLNNFYDSYGETQKAKRTDNYFDQSCDVSTCFDFSFKKDKVTVTLLAQMYRKNNGQVEVLKKISKKKVCKKDEIDKTKEELSNVLKSKITNLKAEAEKRRLQSVKDIYCAA